MKNLFSFMLALLLMVGTANAQAPNTGQSTQASQNISMIIQPFSYIEVLGGDVSFNIDALAHSNTPHQQTADGGQVRILRDQSTTLRYGTNSATGVTVYHSLDSSTPQGGDIKLFIHNWDQGLLTPNDWTLGSAGTVNELGWSQVDNNAPNPVPLVNGVTQGGGDLDLRYSFNVEFFAAPDEGFSREMLFTIGAGTGD